MGNPERCGVSCDANGSWILHSQTNTFHIGPKQASVLFRTSASIRIRSLAVASHDLVRPFQSGTVGGVDNT
jgi:hypothetical protein